MSAEDQLKDILWRLSKAGLTGVMVGVSGNAGETSGVHKGTGSAEERLPIRSSLQNSKLLQMENARS